jgi:endonuclease III
LAQRLGTLDPVQLRDRRTQVETAFAEPPKLHRFVNQVAGWVVDAASIVIDTYGADASAIWSDAPSAADLRARFDAFPGIGQKRAAMAVEILERALHVRVADMEGNDVAYDTHLRRVFLRTGLAEHDDLGHMIAVARALHPQRPGELDNPVWDIGRGWCHRFNPDCGTCPMIAVCPRFIERGNRVTGI